MKVATVLSLAVMASSVSAMPTFRWKRKLITEIRTVYVTEAGPPLTVPWPGNDVAKAAEPTAASNNFNWDWIINIPSRPRKSSSKSSSIPPAVTEAPAPTSAPAPVVSEIPDITSSSAPDTTPSAGPVVEKPDDEGSQTEEPEIPQKPVETSAAPVVTSKPAPVVVPTTSSVVAPAPVETSTPATPADNGLSKFAQTVLNEHNRYRALHSANPLTWSAELAANAASHAAKCVWKHSKTAGQGENIAIYGPTTKIFDGTHADPTSSIRDWYNEYPKYNGQSYTSGAGHFTQVVWKSTTEIGCAMPICETMVNEDGTPALGGKNIAFLVCGYKAPGNYLGMFTQNVQALPNSS